MRALSAWAIALGASLPILYGWLWPRFLLFDALAREIVAFTGGVSGALIALTALSSLSGRRGGLASSRDQAARLGARVAFVVTLVTLISWRINQLDERVPYVESFSLLSLQLSSGWLAALLFYIWARARARRARRRLEGLPGVRALFTLSAVLLGLCGATALGIGSSARAAGALNQEQRVELNTLADLLARGLSATQEPRKAAQILGLLRNEVDLWHERLPRGRPPPLLSDALVRPEGDGTLIVQRPEGGRFHVTHRSLKGGDLLWLIAPANARPPVWAPDEAPALMMLAFLLLGAPIAAFSIGHDLQGQLRRASRNLTALGRAGEAVDITGAPRGIPIDTHDEVGALIWEVNRTCAQFAEDTRRLSLELEQAAHSDQARARFLTDVSHELHAPLREILRRGGALGADPGLTAAQREDIEVIEEANAQLLKHVSDILDLAQLDAAPTLPRGPTPPLPLAPALERLIRAKLPPPEVTLSLKIAPGCPEALIPASALDQVIGNLLSNALKFTREGFVEVSAAPIEPDRVEISVRDSGPGIPAADLEAIFLEFHRVEAQRAVPGTGLGLAIARRLAARWGGIITVRAVEGQGSTFTLSLPAARPAP
ncbi:HAMP domain-containing histidine kinase [Myxococcota bacterium]|nr:HAMP domain-containing histidine kinase [Myxococcota bacterium]MBU1433051.1 HAMP domain-containing histidine kinase [Myxococcota bacterium]MBU1898074.1 HAMP domain-containing histidine kinase [Myxococcota bacterium]